jgi:hypothetical protein
MFVKPSTAFVGKPSGARSGGSAKNARYTQFAASTRTSRAGDAGVAWDKTRASLRRGLERVKRARLDRAERAA